MSFFTCFATSENEHLTSLARFAELGMSLLVLSNAGRAGMPPARGRDHFIDDAVILGLGALMMKSLSVSETTLSRLCPCRWQSSR